MENKIITNPHDLAKAGLVHYSGDSDPIRFDGLWYDSSTWERDGYSSCVEVICWPEGPDCAMHVSVIRGVINKPLPEGFQRAMDSCGFDKETKECTLSQIEAVRGYFGYEPDESYYHDPHTRDYVIPDDCEAFDKWEEIGRFARMRNATIVRDVDAVWEVLNELVGRDLCQDTRNAIANDKP